MKSRLHLLFYICCAFTVHSQIISTVAGTGVGGFSGDGGAALNADLYSPLGIMFDKFGNYYFADILNYRIRKVNPGDTILTVAGTGNTLYNGDNILAINANISPINAAPDNLGNFYISDQGNSRIRKVDQAGNISTVAGTGIAGYAGDNGPAINAEIKAPGLVMMNRNGEVVFTDFTAHCVRKIDTAGNITTIAGTGIAGYTGDNGLATSAQLNGPYAIAQDAYGNYLIADRLNNRIRKIDPSGIITTIAGTGVQGYAGDNGPASLANLNNPEQIALDDAGNIFFADYYNNVIRKIDISGLITTIAGTGSAGYTGDGGLATIAQLKYPWGVAFNLTGDLYIADEGNNVIRKVTNVGVMSIKKNSAPEKNLLQIFPNPSNGKFTVSIPSVTENPTIEIFDPLSESVYKNTFAHFPSTIDVSFLPAGVYYIKASSTEKNLGTQRLIISFS